jgi:hypothetical protein
MACTVSRTTSLTGAMQQGVSDVRMLTDLRRVVALSGVVASLTTDLARPGCLDLCLDNGSIRGWRLL